MDPTILSQNDNWLESFQTKFLSSPQIEFQTESSPLPHPPK